MNKVFIVIGLGFGDEGKGSWVDYLVREHKINYVMRFNGGSQAGHNVVSPEGVAHCFSQFGSGTLVPGTKTCLSKYMLVNPVSLLVEAEVLAGKGMSNVLERILIDENCPVITPFNFLLNRILEISRGDFKHGSCGRGIGITQEDVENLQDDALYVRDLKNPSTCHAKMHFLWKLKLEEAERIAWGNLKCEGFLTALRGINIGRYIDVYNEFVQQVQILSTDEMLNIVNKNSVVFEGAQGVLLDSRAGFFPHITRSNTTFANSENILEGAGFNGEITKIGLLRGYSTRHGTGPFVCEDLNLSLEPCHNQTNLWQGNFRLGWFDCVAAKYALDAAGKVDILALTNLDRMSNLGSVNICHAYEAGSIDQRFFYGEDYIQGIRYIHDLHQHSSVVRTSLLNNCKPVYKQVCGWESDDSFYLKNYLAEIEQFIGHKVLAISVSPTALGKKELAVC